jgi:hypothetical protein
LSLEIPFSLSQVEISTEVFLMSVLLDSTNLAEGGSSSAKQVPVKHTKLANIFENNLTIF